MKRLRVLTVVGTRPEIIRLSCVVRVLDQTMDHVLVHTGQNYDYELNEVFFQDLNLRKPDHFLSVAGRTAAETIGQTIIQVDGVLEMERPDAMLVLGDTNSCLAVIPAKRRKIPIFHMEAGNRCFDMRVPEEINRRIVDHTSDINLCYTEHARRYLLREGLAPDRVIRTGSPMREVLGRHQAGIANSAVLSRLGLTAGQYFVASIHREENVDCEDNLRSLVAALQGATEHHGFPLILSTHPRTRKRIEALGLRLPEGIRSLPPLGFHDYNALQKHCFCALSDSGTITEESSILGFPAITVREAHERPEGMDEGVVVMSGASSERILQAIALTRQRFEEAGPPNLPTDYAPDQVSWTVAKIILSYTDYVNKRTWFK